MRYRAISIVILVVGLLVFAMVALRGDTEMEETGAAGIAWEEKIEVASDDGYRGPWRMNESEWHYVDDATVAMTVEGAIGVAWGDQRRQDIFLQIYEADGTKRFEEPVNVSRSPGIFSWLPRMVMTSGSPGEVYVLWQDIVFSGGSHGGEIFFARSTDGGQTFGRPINLSNTMAGAGKGRLTARSWHNGSLDVALAPDGTIHAAWTEYEGALWLSRSADGGDSFSPPVRIAGDGRIPARGPSLAVDHAGVVYLAWTVGEDPAADIHYAKSEDGGRTFSPAQVVFESDGHADAPNLSADGTGNVHLVFAESPSGPFRDYRILYTRLEHGSVGFLAPVEISSGHPGHFASIHFPAMDVDGDDNLYVMWKLYPPRANQPLGVGFTYSTDGGVSFARPSLVPGTDDSGLGFTGSLNGLLMQELAVNGGGEIALVNSTFRPNRSSHIWLRRGRRSG